MFLGRSGVTMHDLLLPGIVLLEETVVAVSRGSMSVTVSSLLSWCSSSKLSSIVSSMSSSVDMETVEASRW